MKDNGTLPRWVSIGAIPIVNLILAFFVSGVIISFIGENPFKAITVMIKGALAGFPLSVRVVLKFASSLAMVPAFQIHMGSAAKALRQKRLKMVK